MLRLFLLFTFFSCVVFFSCKEKETVVPSNVSTQKQQQKRIEIKLVGGITFRKSYSSIQFMDDEKEIDAYLRKQEKSNPLLTSPEDSLLLKRFGAMGLTRNKELILKKFVYDTAKSVHIRNSVGHEIDLRFDIDHNRSNHILTGKYLMDSAKIRVPISDFSGPAYAFLDVIPGGEKELVILEQYYIMNGDNFDFSVYEIKTQ